MDTKTCGKCEKTLPAEEFSIKNKKTGLRQSRCKACVREYGKQHHQNNKAVYAEKAERNRLVARAKAEEYVRLSLVGQCCKGCSTDQALTYYQGVGAKTQPVYMAVKSGLSLARVQEAIDRSFVVCEPCRQKGFFINGIQPWSQLNQPQRDAERAKRTEPSLIQQDPGRYKNYRRVAEPAETPSTEDSES